LTPRYRLAWLLEPLSVETFLDEIWGKDHHHFTSARSLDGLLPGPSTVDGLLELFRHEPSALRLVRGKDENPGTEAAIKADTRLTDPQKQALLSVYRSYLAENR